jgi:hypothetical protein
MEQFRKIGVVGAAGFAYSSRASALANLSPSFSSIDAQWVSGAVATPNQGQDT